MSWSKNTSAEVSFQSGDEDLRQVHFGIVSFVALAAQRSSLAVPRTIEGRDRWRHRLMDEIFEMSAVKERAQYVVPSSVLQWWSVG